MRLVYAEASLAYETVKGLYASSVDDKSERLDWHHHRLEYLHMYRCLVHLGHRSCDSGPDSPAAC